MRTLTPEVRLEPCRQVSKLRKLSWTQHAIAEHAGLSHQGVINILRRHEGDGAKGLVDKTRRRARGEQRALSPVQETDIRKLICSKTPDQLTMAFALWKQPRVALIVTLQEYVEFVKAEGVAARLSEPYLLFPGRDGGLVAGADERWHRDLVGHVLEGAKLPKFSPYDLRHTFASILLSNGVPLLYVSKQLGHSKPTTTLKHCATWLPKDEQRFVNVLDTHLEKVGTKLT